MLDEGIIFGCRLVWPLVLQQTLSLALSLGDVCVGSDEVVVPCVLALLLGPHAHLLGFPQHVVHIVVLDLSVGQAVGSCV